MAQFKFSDVTFLVDGTMIKEIAESIDDLDISTLDMGEVEDHLQDQFSFVVEEVIALALEDFCTPEEDLEE